MPHGVHAKNQTAFRLPEGLLARLQAHAKDGQTMTDIAARGIAAELDRLDGITTAEPVSPPPKRPRRPRADTAPAATFKQPEPQSPRQVHALTCKCGTCKPTGGKP